METIGTRIAELRRKKNLTQENVAESLGVSPQAVSKWENDQSYPDITLLPLLADLLGTTTDILLRGTGPETAYMEETGRKPPEQMIFRIVIDSNEKDRVRVNLPMQLLRAALEIGLEVGNTQAKDILSKIDIEQVMKMAELGIIGKLVEIDSHDGDHVEIWVE